MFGKSARKSKKESMNVKSRVILDKSFKKNRERPVRKTTKKKNVIKVRKFSIRNLFKRYPNFFKRLGYLLFSVLFITGVVYAFLNLDYFNIKEIEFVHKEEFKYLEESSLESFRTEAVGNNYFKYEVNSQVSNFEKSNSIVKKAYGEKVFPDKLLINVEEREPMFTFIQNNKCLIVDDEAVLVEKQDCQLEQGEDASAENPGNETVLETENETVSCQCIKNDKYPALIPVYLMNSYVDFENMGSSNKYLVRGFLNIRDILEENYYVINSYVILDQSCQIEAYKATENSSGKNTIFLINLEDDLDIQSAKLKVILDYMGELDQYSVVDLRFERPVLQE